MKGDVRTFFLNDQRIQWSGMETTFGAESTLHFSLDHSLEKGCLQVRGTMFLQQPFNRNILQDERREFYYENFQRRNLEIARLSIAWEGKHFRLGLGKHPSLFGRHGQSRYINRFLTFPFIRSEVILPHETGLFFSYFSGIFRLDLAVVNGCNNLDTNSSKGGILRIGIDTGSLQFGASIKAQDGIGSEWQKQYNNHLGVDISFQKGPFSISSEVIYDQYGFHRFYDTQKQFWERSLYYRDVFKDTKTPVEGIGGYISLRYCNRLTDIQVHYGEYHPETIGHPYHDDPVRRLVIKGRRGIFPGFFVYGFFLLENERNREPLFSGASPYAYAVGMQVRF